MSASTVRITLAALVLVALFSPQASAGIINVASCAQAAVQAAVNNASDGDIVNIPAGSCTWASHVGFENKNITIQGAGIGQTLITREGGDNGYIFYAIISNAGKGAFRISGMTLAGNVATSIIYVTSATLAAVTAGKWRVDHIHFNFPTGQRSGVHTAGVNYGLVDHNRFDFRDGVAIRQANGLGRECYDSGFPLSGDLQNQEPLGLGTDRFLFVEDNEFVSNDNRPVIAYDSSAGGGRLVFRKNTVTGGFFYNHWTRGCEMAAQVMEIYGNTFIGTTAYGAPASIGYPIRLEAGTGVIFNNAAVNFRIGSNVPYVILDDRRADKSEVSGWLGGCDGTKSHDGNAGDPAAPGWPCLGQIGRSYGKSLAQIRAGDKPASAPLYLWNNGEDTSCTSGTCPNTWGVWATPAAYIRNTPHPNGEIDYSDNNTPMPGYSPFTYPHPLATGSSGSGSGSSTAPAPPTNVRVVPGV
jgi:hypothetical protein